VKTNDCATVTHARIATNRVHVTYEFAPWGPSTLSIDGNSDSRLLRRSSRFWGVALAGTPRSLPPRTRSRCAPAGREISPASISSNAEAWHQRCCDDQRREHRIAVQGQSDRADLDGRGSRDIDVIISRDGDATAVFVDLEKCTWSYRAKIGEIRSSTFFHLPADAGDSIDATQSWNTTPREPRSLPDFQRRSTSQRKRVMSSRLRVRNPRISSRTSNGEDAQFVGTLSLS
jgi:hypothetical protein